MESITYRLDQFEGPLDLLLNLIHKNKVNIEDIPITLICDQYMTTNLFHQRYHHTCNKNP